MPAIAKEHWISNVSRQLLLFESAATGGSFQSMLAVSAAIRVYCSS
jgi:hypothetical protein